MWCDVVDGYDVQVVRKTAQWGRLLILGPRDKVLATYTVRVPYRSDSPDARLIRRWRTDAARLMERGAVENSLL